MAEYLLIMLDGVIKILNMINRDLVIKRLRVQKR